MPNNKHNIGNTGQVDQKQKGKNPGYIDEPTAWQYIFEGIPKVILLAIRFAIHGDEEKEEEKEKEARP